MFGKVLVRVLNFECVLNFDAECTKNVTFKAPVLALNCFRCQRAASNAFQSLKVAEAAA